MRGNLQEWNQPEVQILYKFKHSNQGIIFERNEFSPSIYHKLILQVGSSDSCECETAVSARHSECETKRVRDSYENATLT